MKKSMDTDMNSADPQKLHEMIIRIIPLASGIPDDLAAILKDDCERLGRVLAPSSPAGAPGFRISLSRFHVMEGWIEAWNSALAFRNGRIEWDGDRRAEGVLGLDTGRMGEAAAAIRMIASRLPDGRARQIEIGRISWRWRPNPLDIVPEALETLLLSYRMAGHPLVWRLGLEDARSVLRYLLCRVHPLSLSIPQGLFPDERRRNGTNRLACNQWLERTLDERFGR